MLLRKILKVLSLAASIAAILGWAISADIYGDESNDPPSVDFNNPYLNLQNHLNIPLNPDKPFNLQFAWSYQTSEPFAIPVVQNSNILILYDQLRTLTALDTDNGTVLWVKTIPEYSSVVPILKDGFVYFSGKSGTLYTFQEHSGELTQVFHIDRMVLPVIIEQNLLLIATQDFFVQAYLFPSIDIQWYFRLMDEPIYPSIVLDQRIIVATKRNRIYAIDINTGSLAWQKQLFEPIIAPLLAYEDSLLLLSEDQLYHCAIQTGEERWATQHGLLTELSGRVYTMVASHPWVFLPNRGYDLKDGSIAYANYTYGKPLGVQCIYGEYLIQFQKSIFQNDRLYIEVVHLSQKEGMDKQRFSVHYPYASIASICLTRTHIIFVDPSQTSLMAFQFFSDSVAYGTTETSQ